MKMRATYIACVIVPIFVKEHARVMCFRYACANDCFINDHHDTTFVVGETFICVLTCVVVNDVQCCLQRNVHAEPVWFCACEEY